jgi:galactose mutarotase-like enzyme
VRLGTVDGFASVTLAAGDLEATFVPGAGMLGTSLRFRGEEHLWLGGGVARHLEGHTVGLPLLHPWANRLRSTTYKAAGVTVDLAGASGWHADGNGLPIHGTLAGRPEWQVLRVAADAKAAVVVTRFDHAAIDELAASFPFPHQVDVEARVEPVVPVPRSRSAARVRLVVTTTVRATGRRRVPVSFGWHPYFRLPGVRRADAVLALPPREHLELDSQCLPTGRSSHEHAEREPLGRRSFDDAYRLGRDRRLALEGGGTRLVVDLDRNYPWAQIYAPPSGSPTDWFVCLEPMTAPIDALNSESVPLVAPGSQHAARFSVSLAGA